jgi:hypothetical protein
MVRQLNFCIPGNFDNPDGRVGTIMSGNRRRDHEYGSKGR